MPIRTLSNLISASGAVILANRTIPEGSRVLPSGAAASASQGGISPGVVSSAKTGRSATAGLNVTRPGKVVKSIGLTSSTADPKSSLKVGFSIFPYSGTTGLDSFTTQSNGGVSSAFVFNQIAAATKATETYLQSIVKAAPNDLATRLISPTTGLSVGKGVNAIAYQGTSGGVRSLYGTSSITATPRRPAIVTLGIKVTVPSFSSGLTSSVAASSLTLTSTHLTALGAGAGYPEAASGIAFITGCKLQNPSIDPTYLDPASVVGRVEARIDSGNPANVQLYLCAGPYLQSLQPAPLYYTRSNPVTPNPNALPYLCPGLWYCWITFISSAYPWSPQNPVINITATR